MPGKNANLSSFQKKNGIGNPLIGFRLVGSRGVAQAADIGHRAKPRKTRGVERAGDQPCVLGKSEFPGESMEMMEIDVVASGLLQLLALPRWDSREMLLRTRFGPHRPTADIREMESLIFWY